MSQRDKSHAHSSKRERFCRDCMYFYTDDRENIYRRESCYFCKRKGPFYSRSFQIGEGTRIDGEEKACQHFIEKEKEEPLV